MIQILYYRQRFTVLTPRLIEWRFSLRKNADLRSRFTLFLALMQFARRAQTYTRYLKADVYLRI